jgi:hypothetical protein
VSEKVESENSYHNAKTTKILKMMEAGKPYNREGKTMQATAFQKGDDETMIESST